MTQNPNSKRILGAGVHPPAYSLGAPNWIPRTVGVYEDVTNSRIFFPAAGYTQSVTYYPSKDKALDTMLASLKGVNRQTIIYDMHKNAIVGSLLYGRARLVLEPNNTYDTNAIQIVGSQPSVHYPIGYVPARCGTNKRIIANWDNLLMDTGQITILKDSKGHLVPMVSFMYNFPVLAKDNRFARLQYE